MISDNNTETPVIDTLRNPPWVAFVQDDNLRTVFDQIAIRDAVPPANIQTGDTEKIRSFLGKGIEPQVLVIDLSKSPDFLKEVKAIINYVQGSTRLVIVGKEDHISIFRELKKLGITDYLILPLEEEQVREAISEALLAPINEHSKNLGTKLKPFTVVLAARGGVGSSTLCVNMAAKLALTTQKKVCLIDFDVYHGSVCILLDLIQNAGLNDALNEVERLDEVFLRRLLLQKEDNFSVLTGQLGLEQEITFSVDALRTLIIMLKDKYDYLFADLPPDLHSPFYQSVLSMADNVIIVTDLSLVSVQGVLRLKTYLSTYMPHVKYQVIANNIFPNGGTISQSMFEKSINSPIDVILPYCKANMLEGINAGESLVKTNPNHAYSKALYSILLNLFPQLKVLNKTVKTPFYKKWWRANK